MATPTRQPACFIAGYFLKGDHNDAHHVSKFVLVGPTHRRRVSRSAWMRPPRRARQRPAVGNPEQAVALTWT